MNRVYIDIDSLFDTRLTTLLLVSKVDTASYLSRVDDNFVNIGEGLFKLLYSRRERPVLVSSNRTAIREMLVAAIMELKEKLIRGGSSGVIGLHVNHYPYLLNDDDKDEIKSLVTSMVNDSIEVSLVYINPREINFDDYSTYLSYEGISLINIMIRKLDLPNNPRPSTVFIVPALMPDGIVGLERDTYFVGMMSAIEAFIDMQFVNVTHFSSIALIDEYNKGNDNVKKKSNRSS